jgi:hypothetical protein
LEQVVEAIERDDMTGFCMHCGIEQSGCEPDCRECRCENCGHMQVYGAEEALYMLG